MSCATFQPSGTPPLQLSHSPTFTRSHSYLRDRSSGSPSPQTRRLKKREKSTTDVVQLVLALFRDREAGKIKDYDPWTVFKLEPGDYEEIGRELEQDEPLQDFVDHKIRYDYDEYARLIAVRMPSQVHDALISKVTTAVMSQIIDIRRGSDKAADFAMEIDQYCGLSVPLQFTQDSTTLNSSRTPDLCFQHEGAAYPGVVIEVLYSTKNIKTLANDYIIGSKGGNIKVVVGIDIAYGQGDSREAKMSYWRSQRVKTDEGKDKVIAVCDGENQIFRDRLGNPTDHPGLVLKLSDFACQKVSRTIPGDQDQELRISASEMCQFLAETEKSMKRKREFDDLSSDVECELPPPSPPEELTSRDEAYHAKAEEHDQKRAKREDRSYRGIPATSIERLNVYETRSRTSPKS